MKQHYCLLKKFNNYFNRKIIRYDSLEDYQNHSADFFIPVDAQGGMAPFDFNPNDNVMTEIIVNDVPFDPDYFLLLDDDENIVQRWYILEQRRNRQGQWVYSLRRDVISDNLSTLLQAPIYVEKGMLGDADPFVLNSEGMSFNEIKTSETLLKDKTKCAWIVGYIARNAAPTDVNVSVPDEDFVATTLSDVASAVGMTEGELASLLNFDGLNTVESRFTNSIEFRYGFDETGEVFPDRAKTIMQGDLTSLKSSDLATVLSWEKPIARADLVTLRHLMTAISNSLISNRLSILSNLDSITGRKYLTSTQLEILRTYLNTPIYYNGAYYRLSLNITGDEDDPRIGYAAYTAWPSIANAFNQAASSVGLTLISTGELAIFTKSTKAYIQMSVISDTSGVIKGINTKISSSRCILTRQVFDMFCIPYGRIEVINGGDSFIAQKDSALSIAAAIAKELDAACYDIQLLPYCPVPEYQSKTYPNKIDISNLTEGKEYNFIDNTDGEITITTGGTCFAQDDGGWYAVCDFDLSPYVGTDVLSYGIEEADRYPDATLTLIGNILEFKMPISGPAEAPFINPYIYYTVSGTQHYSVILWARNNSFSVNLDYKLSLQDSVKVESQCNRYRLVSPNYQGSFEFNVAKNGGEVAYFIAECTYKPYTPYIKVAPAFSYLYGTNYGDCRGLICGGDYSLPRFTDAWESYELSNKNYQNIFNREIQNLDFEQSLQMRQQLISGGLGIASAGIIGAGAGAKAGGAYGAIAGAVVGTAASSAGFAIDTDILAKQQREQRQLAIDKFNYQLGNIKALPYTITKVGSFDINSKIWPFLEYYTCTEEEKEALRSKIRYESMTVMRVDYLSNYISISDEDLHYFKGHLIRDDIIADDPHTLNAIYEEFMKGVYI